MTFNFAMQAIDQVSYIFYFCFIPCFVCLFVLFIDLLTQDVVFGSYQADVGMGC